MTNKERMMNQEYYLGFDEELTKERERSKSLLFEFNNLNPTKRERRMEIINQLIPNIGKGAWIESPFNCDYGTNLTIGKNFYANNNCTLLDCAPITIGNNVLFAPNVNLYTPNHAFDLRQREEGWEQSLPITIEDNVWIGGSVSIVGGVTIGRGSIIGAGSVVTKDIPEGVIAAGNPCKIIREITEEDKFELDTRLINLEMSFLFTSKKRTAPTTGQSKKEKIIVLLM